MIRTLLLSTVALATLAGSAFAADLPSRRAPPVYAPPPPIPVFTWTGLYVGGQVGYGFGRASGVALNSTTATGIAAGSSSPNGIIGGGHIGYLFSTQSLPVIGSYFGGGGLGGTGGVFGIEGDVDGSGMNTSYGIGPIQNYTSRPIQGSIRGRFGIAVDRVLFYATGGAAFGNIRNSYVNNLNGGVDQYSKTRVGYTVGGGIEYAVTNNVSVRAEYRYTDFGSGQNVLANSTLGGITVRRRDSDNRVQAGISYKFDMFTPGPVVARY